MFNKFIDKINKYAEDIGYPYVAYGIFQLISNPIFYIIWLYVDRQGYENLLVRIGISLLCLPLAFSKCWPNKWRRFLPLYWYITILYSIPFFFSFMLLKNGVNFSWVLNTLTGIVLFILLLDSYSIFILLPVGVFCGWFIFVLTGGLTIHAIPVLDFRTLIITYSAVIVFGALFAHRKEVYHQQRITMLRIMVASMAHELRTPLRSIHAGIKVLRSWMPRMKSQADQDLPQVLNNIDTETRAMFTVIEMLLMNVNQDQLVKGEFATCVIADCVNTALERYPFRKGEREMVSFDASNPFSFKGKEDLMIHVLFNLLKNAIYYVRAAGRGEIRIWLENYDDWNALHFKDTGTGINNKDLAHIFEPFYSKTEHGTGIGLAFCRLVMKSFGGEIKCNSELGNFTEFVLKFPKI